MDSSEPPQEANFELPSMWPTAPLIQSFSRSGEHLSSSSTHLPHGIICHMDTLMDSLMDLVIPEKGKDIPMRPSISYLGTTSKNLKLLIAIGCLWSSAAAIATAADLPSLITAAREKFTPVSAAQASAAKAELAKSAGALERYLGPQTTNGKKWFAYLEWDAFKKELAADQPQFDPLVATYQQLNQDQTGLELKPFRNLSAALQHYIDVAVIARQENQAETYGKQLDGLAKELDEYAQSPTSSVGSAIGRRLDLLSGLGQAPDLVNAVRGEFSHPNALVTVSTGLLREAAADPIDRNDPITDVILGTNIRGQGHTTGSVALENRSQQRQSGD